MIDDIFNDIGNAVLAEVLTVTEVRRGWKKTQNSVMMAIFKGRLIARQTYEGGVWLVLRSSVIELWGLPGKDNDNV